MTLIPTEDPYRHTRVVTLDIAPIELSNDIKEDLVYQEVLKANKLDEGYLGYRTIVKKGEKAWKGIPLQNCSVK